ncbi:MAG: L,D-transpeptidase family protein [Bacteroidia bacterium]|nr:L,D-transpeptidase family protein [Bacteroidia bacterium]
MKTQIRLLIFMLLPLIMINCTSPNEKSDRFVYEEVREQWKSDLKDFGLDAEKGYEIFIRAFKQEEILEVYIKSLSEESFRLLKSYDFCTSSGSLGPKRKEGDKQIPEGLYHIDRFNPKSQFHLSLGLNYPNKSDRIKGDPQEPGSDIFIHGKCVTIGCIPLGDPGIEELFVLAEQASLQGQRRISVHIFPAKMESATTQQLFEQFPQHTAFWENLIPLYQDFESKKQLSEFQISAEGNYQLVE